MSDDAALESLRLADSFLPVGTYSLSYALEQFVADDRVTDADDLHDLLSVYLRRQLGPSELVALRAAHEAARADDLERVCTADRRLTAVTLSAEFRDSSEQSGDRLLSLQSDLSTADDSDFLDRYADRVADGAPGNYAVVLGVVTGLAGIELRQACLICVHGFVTGLLGAAQRLLSFGHTSAQRVLTDLKPALTAAVDDSADRTLDEMVPFAPLIDVLAAEHERADRRLFAS
ncbi:MULTISPECIES: urease accessory protein UreF [unclassified Haloferax]|uniref:urease accessory protein UreF n=1 Tax=unclassified Haloferax TaxID=2625095 RepID=UPI0002B2371F|nr:MULTISPECIES: urease accessory UreF family protein [unclassified Haloferax]ELZ61163.1 urease accessory protein F UreF [Haloferax sp. ATCC BAA-645]ELZ61758.1 urease accessory protein F UreF [Haloferax sp. ATCC BAA-646]ELZ71514.1 urease accessory protein F UreF [Haloferax sp. ATCC BAA-644]